MSPGTQRLLESFPWRASDWTLRGILTSGPDVKSRTKVARVFRIGGGLFALDWLYRLFLLPYKDAGSLWPFAAMFAITFGPEAALTRLLPDREYRIADRLFSAVPWIFVAAIAVQAVAAIVAASVGSMEAWTFLFVATAFVCLCPPEFRRLRMLICYSAAATCFAASPRAMIRFQDRPTNLAWNAAFLAFMTGTLSHPVRDRDPVAPENVPARPMQ
jgi:hypothetical protein